MAGYVPESMKEVQGLIAKAYADTVLNAFLNAPELLSIAPVGGKMDYDEQLNDYPIVNFPMKNFAEASAKYIDGIVQKRLEWQTERRRVEYEPEWLEEIR